MYSFMMYREGEDSGVVMHAESKALAYERMLKLAAEGWVDNPAKAGIVPNGANDATHDYVKRVHSEVKAGRISPVDPPKGLGQPQPSTEELLKQQAEAAKRRQEKEDGIRTQLDEVSQMLKKKEADKEMLRDGGLDVDPSKNPVSVSVPAKANGADESEAPKDDLSL